MNIRIIVIDLLFLFKVINLYLLKKYYVLRVEDAYNNIYIYMLTITG